MLLNETIHKDGNTVRAFSQIKIFKRSIRSPDMIALFGHAMQRSSAPCGVPFAFLK